MQSYLAAFRRYALWVSRAKRKWRQVDRSANISINKEPFHKWYYDSGVMKDTRFLGVTCLKSPLDMWNYQEILFELKPRLIVNLELMREAPRYILPIFSIKSWIGSGSSQ